MTKENISLTIEMISMTKEMVLMTIKKFSTTMETISMTVKMIFMTLETVSMTKEIISIPKEMFYMVKETSSLVMEMRPMYQERGIMPLTEVAMVGMPRCGVPVRMDGTNVTNPLFIPSPDATLGDGDSAARCPYLRLPSST
jgi:hypothetical protein